MDGLLCSLRSLGESDIEKVRMWRMAAHIQAQFPSDVTITAEQQRDWFRAISGRSDTEHYMICTKLDQPVGLIWLDNIEPTHGHAEFGFYLGEVQAMNSGIAVEAELMILDHAFRSLELHKVYCESLISNAKVLRMHRRFGFSQDGILRHHAKKNGEFVDLVVMSVLHDEFLTCRPSVARVVEGLTAR